MPDKPTYQAIFYFLVRYRLLYSAVLVLIVVGSLAEGFSLAAFFPVFTSVLNDNQESGGILGLISDTVDIIPFGSPLTAAATLLLALFFFKTMIMMLRVWLTAHASAKVLYRVKRQILERYAGAHYQFFLDNQQGTLIYNTTTAPASVSALLLNLSTLIGNVARVIAIFALLAAIFPWFALGFAAVGSVYYGVIYILSKKISYKIGSERATVGREQGITINEFFTGILQIFASGNTKAWTDRFDQASKSDANLFRREQIWGDIPRHVMEFAGVGLFLGFVLLLSAYSSGGLKDALPKLGVFAVAMVQILPALNGIGGLWMNIMTRLPNVTYAYEAITAEVPRRLDGEIVLDKFSNEIEFRNVSFAHKDRETLLNNASLTFERGKVTAIVGQSGAGKTTIVNLILGLFEISQGTIMVDGTPLKKLNREKWLRKIGFVSQETFTYHTTIAENICFGRDGHSREAIINAAKIAYAHEFISQLPDGYDTTVGDWGMTLSGGQQQRLAIARAVLDSPEILIFDEATSSLDSISETLVQKAIESVSQNRTVIVIAHRLSTIKNADKILVLENGQVVEEGTHDELLTKGGKFSLLSGVNE